jgi:energy-converting hydrogenase Eha subunit A
MLPGPQKSAGVVAMVEHLLGMSSNLQHATTSAFVFLLQRVAVHTAFALALSYTLPIPQKSAGADAIVEHLSGILSILQHAVTSLVVSLLHVVAAHSAFALATSYAIPSPQKSAGAVAIVEHLSGILSILQHALTSLVVSLLHVAAAQSAFALPLSYTLPIPQKSAGAAAIVKHLSGISSILQHAVTSLVVCLLHEVAAQFTAALVLS